MLEYLDLLHEEFGNCRAVARHLGYTLRGYMKIRQKLKNGQPLHHRVETLIRHKTAPLIKKNKRTQNSDSK